MEPFGLFNLLRSLLPQTENPPPSSGENTSGNEAEQEQNRTGANATNAPTAQSQRESSPASTAREAPPNAFLDFINRHDERKKQIKKP